MVIYFLSLFLSSLFQFLRLSFSMKTKPDCRYRNVLHANRSLSLNWACARAIRVSECFTIESHFTKSTVTTHNRQLAWCSIWKSSSYLSKVKCNVTIIMNSLYIRLHTILIIFTCNMHTYVYVSSAAAIYSRMKRK